MATIKVDLDDFSNIKLTDRTDHVSILLPGGRYLVTVGGDGLVSIEDEKAVSPVYPYYEVDLKRKIKKIKKNTNFGVTC